MLVDDEGAILSNACIFCQSASNTSLRFMSVLLALASVLDFYASIPLIKLVTLAELNGLVSITPRNPSSSNSTA